jgi:hypothetical protein
LAASYSFAGALRQSVSRPLQAINMKRRAMPPSLTFRLRLAGAKLKKLASLCSLALSLLLEVSPAVLRQARADANCPVSLFFRKLAWHTTHFSPLSKRWRSAPQHITVSRCTSNELNHVVVICIADVLLAKVFAQYCLQCYTPILLRLQKNCKQINRIDEKVTPLTLTINCSF